VFTGRAERAQAIGAWGASAGAAIAFGPVVGGWLLERSSWPAIFWAMLPVAVLAAALVAFFVPTSRSAKAGALDWGGFGSSTVAMGVLVYTIIEAPDASWGSVRSLGGLIVAAAVLAGFVSWERRNHSPMLDVALFANPRFSAASGSVTVSAFTLFGFIFLITQYFQFVRSYSPLATGVRLLPVALCVGAASVIGPNWLSASAPSRWSRRPGPRHRVLCLGRPDDHHLDQLRRHCHPDGPVRGGLGLTMAPATESIMAPSPKTKPASGPP